MNMTMKEMMLQLNDRMSYMEEHLEHQGHALRSLTESYTLIAEGLKRFIDDFYGPSDVEKPVASVKLPIAVEGNLLEKIKDPKFLKELGERFKKETESMAKLEEELEKIQDQITKGLMGES
tara:strand:- start:320 stop:682 length:363 start_codon:yes stop_codon:yes gene_type:complete